MKRNYKKNNTGLTLIELLLYIALTTSMVLILGGIGVNLLFSREKNLAMEEVRYTADFIFNKVTENLTNSESVVSPATSASSTELVLHMSDETKDPTIFSLLDGVVYIREGMSQPVALSTSRMFVSLFEFAKLSGDGNPETIRIHLQVRSLDEYSSERSVVPKDFFTTFRRTHTP